MANEKQKIVIYEIPNGKRRLSSPTRSHAVKAMTAVAKGISLMPDDEYLKWVCLQYVALIGLKIALLNHEVAWDLWNKADALASKLQPWYPVDKTFEACAKNVEFFNAYGHPKTGPKRVLNQRQSDVITKNGGGDEDINKAMDWINKTWYQDGMPKEFSGDVVREKYAKERNEIVRLCGAHWREE